MSDNFDPDPTVTLVSVTSNEADNGLGDGDMPDNIVIIDDFTFDLRAERMGALARFIINNAQNAAHTAAGSPCSPRSRIRLPKSSATSAPQSGTRTAAIPSAASAACVTRSRTLMKSALRKAALTSSRRAASLVANSTPPTAL